MQGVACVCKYDRGMIYIRAQQNRDESIWLRGRAKEWSFRGGGGEKPMLAKGVLGMGSRRSTHHACSLWAAIVLFTAEYRMSHNKTQT